MRTPRFNGRSDQRLAAHWIRFPDLAAPRVSGRKKIFAVVSPPIPIDAGRRAIRRVLIFDNHPATLRYLRDLDLAQRRKITRRILAGLALLVIASLGMLLTLL
jgi:hypothetical protein